MCIRDWTSAEALKNDTTKNITEFKYLLNGIKDQNGKYYSCWYGFDNITLTIAIHHKEYGDLPILKNQKGFSYKDDTDSMSDYFCKPSIYLTPESNEYFEAFETLERIEQKEEEKQKNYRMFKISEQAKKQTEILKTSGNKDNLYKKILKEKGLL